MAKTELTCMVMVYDAETEKVLIQERRKSWVGASFPGGHVEAHEGLVEAAIREIREETGLTVSDLEPCGVIHFCNADTGDRYFVFNFRTSRYSGQVLEATDEGRVFWVSVDDLPGLTLASGFAERLPMFFEGKFAEGFCLWNDAGLRQMKWFEYPQESGLR